MKRLLIVLTLLFSCTLYAKDSVESELKQGLDLLYNRNGKHNPQAGYKWLEQAALKDDMRALFNLGICCEQGLGTEKNLRLAADYYKRAGEKGLPHAKFNYALCVRDGVVGDPIYQLPAIYPDSVYASQLLLELAENNFSPAQREYALLNRNTKKGLFYLEKSALNGDAVAQVLYADYLMNTPSTNTPLEKIYQLYDMAAKQNNLDGLAKKGWFLEQGLGVNKDSVQAVACYEKASKLNHAMGMTQYARCLIKGIGTEKDYDVALSLLIICAKTHYDPYAFYLLGTCSIEGIGQAVDREAADRFFSIAAKMKYAPAIYQLAMLKWSTARSRPQIKEVINLLEEAVELGDADAMQTLGMMYIKGDNVATDEEYGQLLLKKAAQNGASF